ncbi:MAG: ribosomal protein S18-alanine N-acetyltransferase [Clostridia bacterium]|nr:ribosomal protein S18-alanine N-acetyltransferase [Clostridia bacterium]
MENTQVLEKQTVCIRHAVEKDIPEITAIEQSEFHVPWSEESIRHDILENPASRWVILADVDDHVIAYAGMWLVIDEGHVLNVAVRRADQGRGYGRQVMEALIQVAKDDGMRLMTLEVRRSNVRAQGLYHRCGFLDVGYRKRYYDDNREDALIMYQDLV